MVSDTSQDFKIYLVGRHKDAIEIEHKAFKDLSAGEAELFDVGIRQARINHQNQFCREA